MPDAQVVLKESKTFWDRVKTVAAPIGSVIGAITLVYQFVQIWRGDQATLTWLTAGAGGLLALAGLVFVAFSQVTHPGRVWVKGDRRPSATWKELRFPRWHKAARWGLAVCALLIGIAGVATWRHLRSLDEKTIIVITLINGPDPENNRVSHYIHQNLVEETSEDESIQVIFLDNETITEGQGSHRARQIGVKRRADLVVWGWYGATPSNVVFTMHIENMSGLGIEQLRSSGVWETQTTISMLQTYTLQQDAASVVANLVFFVKGLALMNTGDCAGALAAFNSVLPSDNSLSVLATPEMFYFARGTAYLCINDNQNAIVDLNEAIRLSPRLAEAYLNRGSALANLGHFDKAIGDCSEAISLAPESGIAYRIRGNIYLQMQSYNLAALDYGRDIQIGDNVVSRNNRGVAYYMQGQTERAIQDYTRAIDLDPRYPTPYIHRGLAYDTLGETTSAIGDLDHAISLDSTNAAAYSYRGTILAENGQIDEAMRDFAKAILLGSDSDVVYFQRAQVYANVLGQYENAITDLTEALRIDPQDSRNYIERGICYGELQKYDLAIADFSRAIMLSPTSAEAYTYRGNAESALGNYEAAQADFMRAVALCGDDQALCRAAQDALDALPELPRP